jgi:hypothetical protein
MIMFSRLSVMVALAGMGLATGCAVRSVHVEVVTPTDAVGTFVWSPLKTFHADGTIAVFRLGAQITEGAVVGEGMKYSLDLAESVTVRELPLDGIIGIEIFRGGVDGDGTMAGTAATGAGAGVAIWFMLGAVLAGALGGG